ncbi:MAG: hypothetical protein GKR90_23225 [Pseudomonadales bacterium]|nr:hypothetical protein [Pseudomonadales bacterium]
MRKAAAVTLLCMAGCTSLPQLESLLETYEGLPIEDVRVAFGEPSRTKVGAELSETTWIYGKRRFRRPDCQLRFVFREEQVRRWNWAGRHCESFYRSTVGVP